MHPFYRKDHHYCNHLNAHLLVKTDLVLHINVSSVINQGVEYSWVSCSTSYCKWSVSSLCGEWDTMVLADHTVITTSSLTLLWPLGSAPASSNTSTAFLHLSPARQATSKGVYQFWGRTHTRWLVHRPHQQHNHTLAYCSTEIPAVWKHSTRSLRSGKFFTTSSKWRQHWPFCVDRHELRTWKHRNLSNYTCNLVWMHAYHIVSSF